MQLTKLDLPRREIDYTRFIKRRAAESDCTLTIDEPTILTSNGKLVAIYDILDADVDGVVEAVTGIKYSVSERTGGLKSTSRVFGYMPRITMRRDYCTSVSLAFDSPKKHAVVAEFGKLLSKNYQLRAPEVYAKHLEELGKKIKPDWVIPDSVFTSGIINKNNPLKYHLDTGNIKDVFSCMLVLRQGVEGGYLCLPEFDVKFMLKDKSVFMFDGQGIVHGVTPMRVQEGGYRYSLVYYAMRQLWKCMTIDQELARIKQVKTEREVNRATNLHT